MAKENEETKPEGTEPDDSEDDDREAQQILAKTLGKKPAASETDDEDESDEAEVEAGASDTVPRSEMVKAIKARQLAKKKLREMEAEIKAERAKNETESETKIREAQEKIATAVTNKYKPALVKTGAEAALLAAKPKKGKAGISRLIKLMDLEAIDVTEDLELEGVEEEVVRLQEEFPELFGDDSVETDEDTTTKPAAKAAIRRTTSRSQDGAGKKPAAVKKSTSELIMAKMRGES